ncbi:hypothetical protein [Pedobacter aquatilis]|uniref:hypothetical protein n=1 Tax=Pedobacter aquatilis TaxID=351343 RepID=UPI00292D6A23|nr:hypothetical protein [Pedobacter aquatilis]
MDNRNSKFGIIGFLLIMANLQTTPSHFKYFFIIMAIVFSIREIAKYHKEFKTNRFQK